MRTVNTKEWTTTAQIMDPERKRLWEAALGTDRVPIISMIPQECTLPGFDSPQLVYMLDLYLLTDEQRSRLVEDIARRFNLAQDEVAVQMDEKGCPILAEQVSVQSSDMRLLFSLMEDDLDEVSWCNWCGAYGHRSEDCAQYYYDRDGDEDED